MPTLLRRVGVLCVILSGCSLDSEGTAGDLEPLGDSGELDSSAGDTAPVDQDTYVPDTTSDDVVATDTIVDPPPDSALPPDTAMPDTAPVDTGPETPTVVPSLFGESGQLTGDGRVNLTSEGTIDWAHWGHVAGPSAWNHKSGASALTNGAVGTPAAYGSFPIRSTWTGGTPTAMATDSRWGIYHDNMDESFSFEAAGDPAVERTLRVYVTWNSATGTVEAKLSDATPTWSGNMPPPGATGTTSGTIYPAWFQFKFKPATSAGKLQIKVTQKSGGGYIGLMATTLK